MDTKTKSYLKRGAIAAFALLTASLPMCGCVNLDKYGFDFAGPMEVKVEDKLVTLRAEVNDHLKVLEVSTVYDQSSTDKYLFFQVAINSVEKEAVARKDFGIFKKKLETIRSQLTLLEKMHKDGMKPTEVSLVRQSLDRSWRAIFDYDDERPTVPN